MRRNPAHGHTANRLNAHREDAHHGHAIEPHRPRRDGGRALARRDGGGVGAVARRRRHRVGRDGDGAGAVHVGAGPGALLRRDGARERGGHPCAAVLRRRVPGDGAVGGGRLQPRLRREPRGGGGLAPGALRGRRRRLHAGHDSGIAVCDLPGDVRHHHAGARRRRARRTPALPRGAAVRRPLLALRLRPGRALGVGRGVARAPGRARLRRRARGAHDGRCRGAGGCHRDGPETRLPRRARPAPQPAAHRRRRRDALGRVARLQRGERGLARTPTPPWR